MSPFINGTGNIVVEHVQKSSYPVADDCSFIYVNNQPDKQGIVSNMQIGIPENRDFRRISKDEGIGKEL